MNNTHIRTNTTQCSSPSSFDTYISQLPLWEKHLISHHESTDELHIAATQTTNNIIIATDGSENNGKGSYGWIICTTAGHTIATGSGTSFGFAILSFRCEAYGILAALRFIIHLLRYHHVPQNNNHIQWWCDCQSLLRRLQHTLPNPNQCKLAEHDIELAVIHTMRQLSPRISSSHLHSHQYDTVPLHNLPLPYRLNRIADTLAKRCNDSIESPQTQVPRPSPARCQLHIGNHTITRSIATTLHFAYSKTTSLSHIATCLQIPPNMAYTIAWKEFAQAFKSFSPGHQRILRRWIYGFLPTQQRLFRNGTSNSELCPICRQVTETDQHFLDNRDKLF